MRTLLSMALLSIVPFAILTVYLPLMRFIPEVFDAMPVLLAGASGVAGLIVAPWPPQLKGLAATLFVLAGMLGLLPYALAMACGRGNCI